MNPAQAIQVAARRYCSEQHADWANYYGTLPDDGRTPDGDYSTEAYQTFPRYMTLNTICIELERLDPDLLRDLSDTRSRIIAAGECALDEMTNYTNPLAKQASQEERDKFCAYIERLTEDDLRGVAPLPYRHFVNSKEETRIRAALREHWGIEGGYWYPLTPRTNDNTEAFRYSTFVRALRGEVLQDAMRARGIERYWCLDEFHDARIESTERFETEYLGFEAFSTSESLDWIAYVSHEDSVTFGGWMLAIVQAEAPDWREYLYNESYGIAHEG
ncbi:MAG: hypothetical protein DHS20C14_07320 [Phycisphaeraceae bacterium]|nr:MAG: hypothetical protein DHS20C14_07320 [Phycisphaeraceae bacterium]